MSGQINVRKNLTAALKASLRKQQIIRNLGSTLKVSTNTNRWNSSLFVKSNLWPHLKNFVFCLVQFLTAYEPSPDNPLPCYHEMLFSELRCIHLNFMEIATENIFQTYDWKAERRTFPVEIIMPNWFIKRPSNFFICQAKF